MGKRKAALFSAVVLMVLILGGCSVRQSVHSGVHEQRSQGLAFQGQKTFDFDVSPQTRKLSFELTAKFSNPVTFEVIDPSGDTAHRQSFDRVTTHFELPPQAGEWLIRLTADRSTSGDYYLKIRER